MATWVGVFVSNLDRQSVRKLWVEASSETDALIKLDFYEYDETWRDYSFVDVYKQKWGGLKSLFKRKWR
ncbi:MAG TPA: hypothetical protein V6D37_05615 [Candidatus Sericytochromatia bacterium]|jgi:hypothetical protein